MNERIQELAARIYGSQATEQEIKFAELIVRECIDSVENTNDRYRKDYFADKIRERFGVEK